MPWTLPTSVQHTISFHIWAILLWIQYDRLCAKNSFPRLWADPLGLRLPNKKFCVASGNTIMKMYNSTTEGLIFNSKRAHCPGCILFCREYREVHMCSTLSNRRDWLACQAEFSQLAMPAMRTSRNSIYAVRRWQPNYLANYYALLTTSVRNFTQIDSNDIKSSKLKVQIILDAGIEIFLSWTALLFSRKC
jgi:hypothetical protein